MTAALPSTTTTTTTLPTMPTMSTIFCRSRLWVLVLHLHVPIHHYKGRWTPLVTVIPTAVSMVDMTMVTSHPHNRLWVLILRLRSPLLQQQSAHRILFLLHRHTGLWAVIASFSKKWNKTDLWRDGPYCFFEVVAFQRAAAPRRCWW